MIVTETGHTTNKVAKTPCIKSLHSSLGDMLHLLQGYLHSRDNRDTLWYKFISDCDFFTSFRPSIFLSSTRRRSAPKVEQHILPTNEIGMCSLRAPDSLGGQKATAHQIAKVSVSWRFPTSQRIQPGF
jgi:hypothetical protein